VALTGRVIGSDGLATLSAEVSCDGLAEPTTFPVAPDGSFQLERDLDCMRSGTTANLHFRSRSAGDFSSSLVSIVVTAGSQDVGDVDLGLHGFAPVEPSDGATGSLPCAFGWNAYLGSRPPSEPPYLLVLDQVGTDAQCVLVGSPTGYTVSAEDLLACGSGGSYFWTVTIQRTSGPATIAQRTAGRSVSLP